MCLGALEMDKPALEGRRGALEMCESVLESGFDTVERL
jgi:hypothetical protein